MAYAANAYITLLDLGMNTGAVKYYSQWIALGKYDLIDRVSRTNLSFYLLIGIINSVALLVLAFFGESVFKMTPEQFVTFRNLLLILASFTVFYWTTFVFNQLLVSDEKIGFTQKIFCTRSVLNVILIITTISYKWSIIQYFFVSLFINALIIIPYYYVCQKRKLIQSLFPAFYWRDFAVVFKYSLTIFAMGIFQFTASQSRPLILGMFSTNGVGVLTDYRVIEVFAAFIISLGGIITPILLPKTSKAIQGNDRSAIEKMAYEGTKYTSILVSFLCFPFILNAKELLTLYVGNTYGHLSVWLSLWIFTITLYLHSTPVSSLILSTGKLRKLVFSTAISCAVSMIINAMLCKYFGVGSAIIGFLIYIIIQMSFYYLYFNNKILGLRSLKVFKSFIVPTAIGFVLMVVTYFVKIKTEHLLLQIVVNSSFWCVLYASCLVALKIIDVKMIYLMLQKKRLKEITS